MYKQEYTVSELVNNIKILLESSFHYIKVKGEISSFKTSTNGHIYFNLKDEKSLINTVLFKNYQKSNIILQDGLNVVIYGKITTYIEKSNYQIIADNVEIFDEGSIYKIIEERKKKLEKEGLFNRKRVIPKNINSMGIITAPNGAAIKDIEVRLRDRLIPDNIILYPSLVQGQEADKNIVNGIKFFNNKNNVDIIVITRGGGSLEDLMCFNSEELSRAIFNSKIPVITAIGHEIDWTIVDYVSDLRLPTPTSVAESLFPLKSILYEKLSYIYNNILKVSFRILCYLLKEIEYIFKKIFVIYYKNINNKEKIVLNIFNSIILLLSNKYIKKLNKINIITEKIKSFNKNKILKKGYACISKNGKIINNKTLIKPNDIISIEIYKKKFKIVVKEVVN